MKESQFIKENSQKWAPVESSIRSLKSGGKSKKSKVHPNMGDDFVRISDDLSYAQTFYRRRSVRLYLNSLAADLYRIVYKHSEGEKNPLIRFWTQEIPTAMYQGRKAFLISLIVFVGAMLIGAFSLSQNAGFANEILSDSYVQQTEANIESGDILAVYKDSDSFSMFTQIALNNLKVMILCFILGLFFGIGSLGALFTNGIMVGVFQYYFHTKGLLWPSFLTIWQHGTIEISSIIISGGAGLMLGSALIFPKNYSRLLSLRLQFYRGMKVILALIPFIVLAAFIESYITRHDDINDWVRLTFIIINALLIGFYFIYLPYRVGRRKDEHDFTEQEKDVVMGSKIDENDVLTAGSIFQLSISKLNSFGKSIFKIAIIASVVGAFVGYLERTWVIENTFIYSPQSILYGLELIRALAVAIDSVANTFYLFEWNSTIPLAFLLLLGIVSVQTTAAKRLNNATTKAALSKGVAHFIFLFIGSLLITLHEVWIFVFLVMILPIGSMSLHLAIERKKSYFVMLTRSFSYYFSNFALNVPWIFLSFVALFLLTILAESLCVYVLFDFLNSFLAMDQIGDPAVISSILYFLSLMVLFTFAAFAQLGYGFVIRTIEEKRTADHLRTQIANIPPRKKRYGIDEVL